MSSEKYRKAGKQAAEVLVRTALSQVPVVGPFLSGGIELIGAVRNEMGKDAPMSRQDVLDLIHRVPREEYERIVDEQLVSDDNTAVVGTLGPSQLLELRRQLVSLPNNLGRMLATAQAADENAHNETVTTTSAELQTALDNHQWFRTNRLARRMRRMGVRNRELVELERYTYRRHRNPGRLVFYTTTLLVAAVITSLTLTRFDLKFDRTMHLLPLFAILLLLWIPATSGRLTISVRTTFKIITFVYLGIWLLRFYKVWPDWLQIL